MAKPRNITENIIELANQGFTPKEIKGCLNCAISNVYKTLDNYCIDYKRTKTIISDELKEKILELRRAENTYSEIAQCVGVSKTTIKGICLDNGLALGNVVANQYGRMPERIEHAKGLIKKKNPNLEYYGGFISVDDVVDLRCIVCGEIFTRSMISIRNKGEVNCPTCKAKERQKIFDDKRKQKILAKQKAIEERKHRAEIKRLQRIKEKEHPCPVCGTITVRKKYCSDTCAKRVENKKRELKRRIKINVQMVDKDITLESLFKRDKGACHICGLQCNWDDYIVRDDQKLCGDWYPSIDHVIPLAKGGLHSWKNVKLAHRRCNYVKSDEIYC